MTFTQHKYYLIENMKSNKIILNGLKVKPVKMQIMHSFDEMFIHIKLKCFLKYVFDNIQK